MSWELGEDLAKSQYHTLSHTSKGPQIDGQTNEWPRQSSLASRQDHIALVRRLVTLRIFLWVAQFN